MEPKFEGTNTALIGTAVALLLIIGGAAYFLTSSRAPSTESQIPEITEAPDVSAEVGAATETPADKLPETNPFSESKNPFE